MGDWGLEGKGDKEDKEDKGDKGRGMGRIFRLKVGY
jgi:hypothetical protein